MSDLDDLNEFSFAAEGGKADKPSTKRIRAGKKRIRAQNSVFANLPRWKRELYRHQWKMRKDGNADNH